MFRSAWRVSSAVYIENSPAHGIDYNACMHMANNEIRICGGADEKRKIRQLFANEKTIYKLFFIAKNTEKGVCVY